MKRNSPELMHLKSTQQATTKLNRQFMSASLYTTLTLGAHNSHMYIYIYEQRRLKSV